MKLPDLSESASPEFSDAASCKAWLENVPLANVAGAQGELIGQLSEFNRFPVAAVQRLAVLEALREAVHFVQIEQSKRFSNRALPMTDPEAAAFEATIGLWEQMRIGYQRCLDAALNRDSGMKAQSGLICQRLAVYVGLKMYHHYRGYRQVPAGNWQALHEVYAAAEKLGVEDDGVKDFMNRDIHDTSPAIAYARAVLMGISNPNELGPRQITFIAYLLERWASKLEISAKAVDEGEGVPPLVADLASDECPGRREGTAPGDARYLDTRKLSKSLRNRVALLRKGESPAKLALGEDCVQPACEQLLVYLYRQWCVGKAQRAVERTGAESAAEVCTEIAGIHYYISGRVFRAPTQQSELTQKQREEIATFGHVVTREAEDYSAQQGFVVEQWQLQDESAQGMRLVRRAGDKGKRLAHGQLIGVRPTSGKQFMLGQVRWLMQAEKGDLHAGVKLLPGLPNAISVRPTGLNVQEDSWVPALSLAAVPALDEPVSLIVPSGWYKPRRIVELHMEGNSKAALTKVIERGADFERVAYERVP
jgi:cyclic-di-GMP-binding protein